MKLKMTMCFITVDKVLIGERMRKLDEEAIIEMMDSFKTAGQIHAITVDKNNYIVDGLHRLEAARRLGWETIFARLSEETPERNKLIEIDANLKCKSLTVMERSVHLLERKKIYEQLNPASKQYSKEMMSSIRRGDTDVATSDDEEDIPYYAVQNEDGTWRERTNQEYIDYIKSFPEYNDRPNMEAIYDPRIDHENWQCVPAVFDILERRNWSEWNDCDPKTYKFGPKRTDVRPEIILPKPTKIVSFTKDTAEKLGVSERSVQREVAIANKLSQEIIDLLTGTALADRKADLILLGQQDPEVQEEIVQMFLSGEITKISEYFDSDKGSVRNRKKKDNPYELPAEPKMKAKPKFDDEDDEKPEHDYDTVNMKEDIVALLKTYSTSKSRVCQDAIKKINMYLLTIPTIKY